MVITIYVILCVCLAVMMLLSLYSIFVYKNACNLYPLKLKKDELEKIIIVLKNDKIKLDEEIKRLQTEKDQTIEIIKRKEECEDFLKTHDQRYREKLKLQEDINNQINEAYKKLDQKNNDLFEAQKKYNELSEEISGKTQEKNKLDADILHSKNELDDVQSKIKAASNDITQKRAELDRLNKQISELSGKLSELKEKERTYDDLKKGIERARSEIKALNADILEKQNLQQKLSVDEKLSERCWEDLDTPVFTITKADDECGDINENDWLDEFKDELNKCNIEFSDRTINAFHTGLKVAESSPLVVLSGISGTGKSLLPQLYAKAIGMNFLPIAVQPRWDSPQDLTGFYNYVQSKFKATELSRLLWQYDFYNNKNAQKKFATVDHVPMNLVLLDEMNLARVEYYFSDLLSKLETRRNIGKDDSDRKKAEIELECSVSGSKSNIRRLFVNTNTLFVGTMNEDETTQSLSDKVMDRSNLLRFGKPVKLVSKPDVDQFNDFYSEEYMEGYLSLSKWKSMLNNNIPNNMKDKVRETVDDLNKILESVGRPFAHRVWQSIENYVSQYPLVTSKNNLNNAISDQIEMKILPKLNGIEKNTSLTNKAFDDMKGIIDGLKDEDLSRAFEDAVKDQSSVFFKWKGVAR